MLPPLGGGGDSRGGDGAAIEYEVTKLDPHIPFKNVVAKKIVEEKKDATAVNKAD